MPPIGTLDRTETDRYVRELTPNQLRDAVAKVELNLGERWSALTDDQRIAQRARNELARRGVEVQREQDKEAEQEYAQARRKAEIKAQHADLKRQRAAGFPGTAAQFEAQWPAMLADWQRQQAEQNTPVARKRRESVLDYGF